MFENIQNFDYIWFISNLFSNITLEWFFKIIVIYFFIVWISIIIWVTRDIINRTNNLFFQIISILIPVILTPFWLIIYLLIRPSRTLFEKEFETDASSHIELLAQDTEKHYCFNCDFEVKKDYIYCPNCKTKLKHNCIKCKKEIDSNFKNCPYCWEEQIKKESKEEKSKELKLDINI